MIKRIIDISREACHVSVRLEQLVIQPFGEEKQQARCVPCEDIGVLLVDHPQVTLTHQAMAMLMHHGAAVIVCGRDHLPAGLLVPLSSHTQVLWRVNDQVNATPATRNRLWQQIVAAKIRAQAARLPEDAPARRLLVNMAKEVKVGDSTNLEAQAAKAYWSAWPAGNGAAARSALVSSVTAGDGPVQLPIPDSPAAPGEGPAKRRWTRDPDHLDPLNVMLNYGYAVLRAAVARALVSAGLFPALALHHRHRANTFALADDLVEPLRPMIDRRVSELHERKITELSPPAKAHLLSVLHAMVAMEKQTGPLMVALHRYTASLHRCLTGQDKRLAIPLPEGPPSAINQRCSDTLRDTAGES